MSNTVLTWIQRLSHTMNKNTMRSNKFIYSFSAYLLSASLFVVIFKLSIVFAQGTISTEVHYGSFESCTSALQEAAHDNLQLWRCEPRDQIVELELPNSTYFHMIPQHIRVKRCGGTCSASV